MPVPRLYVAAMNDGLFIIDQPPRPAPVDYTNPHTAPDTNCIAALGADRALADKLVAAWNGVLDAPVAAQSR